jgi:hypothetical protein
MKGKSETSDQYLGIVALLIESYALETVWNIAFCLFCAFKLEPVDHFFDPTIIQVDVREPPISFCQKSLTWNWLIHVFFFIGTYQPSCCLSSVVKTGVG